MKKGDKIVCIDSRCSNLTLNKVYNVRQRKQLHL